MKISNDVGYEHLSMLGASKFAIVNLVRLL